MRNRKLLQMTLIAATFALSATTVVAQPALTLKTSPQDVNGVREVEAGNYDKGIAKLKAVLSRTTVSGNRTPLLQNLCVAYIATGQLEAASEVCNEATHTDNEVSKAIAYNNRAVLHYMKNDIAAAASDLKVASETFRYQSLIEANKARLQQFVAYQAN